MNVAPSKVWILLGLLGMIGCNSPAPTPQSPTAPRPSIPRPYYADTGVRTEELNIDTSVKVSFKDDIVPLMKRHCAACHAPGGPGALAHQFFDAEGNARYREIGRYAHHVIEAIEQARMPPGKPQALTREELNLLRVWFYQGLPYN